MESLNWRNAILILVTIFATAASNEPASDILKGASNVKGSPIHAGVLSQSLSAVVSALESGGDVNEKISDGSTPLHLAVYTKNYEIARYLIEKGADLNAENSKQNSVLHTALLAEAPLEIISLLIDNGANVEAPDDEGHTPLMIAARKHNIPAVKILIGKGASDETKNHAGLSAKDYVKKIPTPTRKDQTQTGSQNRVAPEFQENAKVLKTKDMNEWGTDDVQFWLSILGFKPPQLHLISETFRKGRIDGIKLEKMTEQILQQQYEVTAEAARTIIHARDKMIAAKNGGRRREEL